MVLWTRCDLLQAILSNCQHSSFTDLLELVQGVLDEEVQRSKTALIKRIEQCYAVKSGNNGFLDMARANFCR